MRFIDFLRGILRGFPRIGYSSGKPFDPSDQERTDAMDDIAKAKEKRSIPPKSTDKT